MFLQEKGNPVRKISICFIIMFFITALLAVSYYTVFYIINPQLDIDEIYNHANPDKALKGPAYETTEGGSELKLDEKYTGYIGNESLEITPSQKLAVINRWSKEIYPYYNVFMISALMDSTNLTYYRDVTEGTEDFGQRADKIAAWTSDNLLHTQHVPQFLDQPGHDPWGRLSFFQPALKKTLPSEMVAESLYTGKITGKCCSLAPFVMSLFALNGAAPDDIIALRLSNHIIALVKYDGKIYFCSNMYVAPLSEREKHYLLSQKFYMYFSYSTTVKKSFRLNEAFFKSEGSLLDAVAKLTNTQKLLPSGYKDFIGKIGSREDIFERVFGTADTPDESRTYSLARYAYQSLYVKNPELYLEASVRAPVIRELGKRFKKKEQIFEWISSNIDLSPLFTDYKERIMLADQVVIFRKGTLKDQAVLAYSLLKNMGLKPEIYITENKAYIKILNDIFDVSTWHEVDNIVEPVLLLLKEEAP